ncbi:MAG: hypothetical protein V1900_00720 [Candidatus Aenigmatarchaeota archaeon]
MHVVKKYEKTDDRTRTVFKLFDRIIQFIDVPYENLVFSVGDTNKIEILDFDAAITIDYKDPFVQSCDEKAIKIIILRMLLKANLKKFMDVPEFIEDIIVNRKIAKKFSDELFYYYYIIFSEHGKGIEKLNDFIGMSLPWLSFHGIDNYSSDFFRETLYKFRYRKEFEMMTKNLFSMLKNDLMDEKTLANVTMAFDRICK